MNAPAFMRGKSRALKMLLDYNKVPVSVYSVYNK